MRHHRPEGFRIGASPPRVEDQRFVTGQGRFGDDINVPGQLYAAFALSEMPAGAINTIDLEAAHGIQGVVAAYTGEDIGDDLAPIPSLACRNVPLMRPDGTRYQEPPRHPLAKDRVRFVGEPVAMVIGETPEAARDGAEAVMVEIDEAAFVLDVEVAAEPGAPTVWPHMPDNTAFVMTVGDAAAVDAAMAAAAHVATVRVPFTRLAMSPMEPRTALGAFDEESGTYTLTCGTQNPHTLARLLAEDVLRVPAHKVRLITPDMGGAFGLRAGIFPEMALALWAAKTLGRPVKWTGTRSAALLSDDMGRDMVMSAELALDENGTFEALRVRSVASLGAYTSMFGPMPAFGNLGGLAGVYRTPLISAHVRAVHTNTVPIAPYRGAGRPEAVTMIELAIDAASRQFGFDRLDLRRRNMIGPDALPYKTGLSYTYDSGDFPAAMAEAERVADVAGFPGRREAAARQGKLRGLGLANAIEASAGALDEGASLDVEADGTATLFIGGINHGQGHETVLRQIVCEALGLDPEAVRIVAGDTAAVPYGVGSFGSRTAALGGSATLIACQRVIEQAMDTAATALETAPETITFDEGRYIAKGTNRSLSFQDVAAVAAAETLSAQIRFAADKGPTFPSGTHVCEVEVDEATGALTVLSYVTVSDVGTLINPMLVEGQIHGGVVQGLGQVIGEQVVYDPGTGQPLTGSFMDYPMPRADDIPSIKARFDAHPTAKNPLGAKGAGEAGTVGALPAALAAVADALAPLGIDGVDMPATPARLWTLINTAKRTAP
ncbi:MAG: xanthine dehydrogenase family protein molybdopterin-binding subunit [Devosia sp.]